MKSSIRFDLRHRFAQHRNYGGDSSSVQTLLQNVREIVANEHAFCAILENGDLIVPVVYKSLLHAAHVYRDARAAWKACVVKTIDRTVCECECE